MTKFLFLPLALCVTLAPAAFAEVRLPKGSLTGASNTCQDDVVEIVLRSGKRSWPMEDGKLLALKTRKDAKWEVACVMSWGEATAGTGCSDKGYVVAGRAGGDVRIACYKGDIPAKFEYD